jgi:hypothetical protein
MAFGSRRISLVERSCSSFTLVVFIYLCAGEDLTPSSGNTDKGCQWEIQTEDGWVPYWDSQV